MEYSVLMTVYKGDNPKHFEQALLSMINQSKKPNQIVLVLDGPVTQQLENIVESLKQQNNILDVIELPTNIGLGLALNEGLKYCKNELVARMDADDFSMPSRCQKQVEQFEKNPSLDIIGCPVLEFVNNTGNIVGKRNVPLDNDSIYKYCKRRDPFNHPTVMFKKSKVLSVGGYSDLRKNQDTDLWIKLLSNGAVCMNLPDYLFKFRFDEGTYAKRKNRLNTKLLIKIRREAFKSGFCSIADFLIVAIGQMAIFILPISFQKFIYTKMLRR